MSMTWWCCNKEHPDLVLGWTTEFVVWGLETWASSGHLKARRSQNETNMRGSSVSLENIEISKEIHRKSKFISSRGEDTEVMMQLLLK